jgi:hypothetical protein
MSVHLPGDRRLEQAAMEVTRNTSMTRKTPKRRTPEEIRAGTRRLGLILFTIAAAFFVAAFVKQIWFS